MTTKVLDGKKLAHKVKTQLKADLKQFKSEQLVPHLTVILVGENPASLSYVNGKQKAATEVGISSKIIRLSEEVSETDLLTIIHQLNDDDSVHGILVQLPLPDHIEEQKVIEAIHPAKDVDGFHPVNIGKMMTEQDVLLPCTPLGILTILKEYNISIEGKHAVIIGRSNIVGKPVGQLLLNENATVTYCHSRTENLTDFTKSADILIVAIGMPNRIKAEHIKEGAVVIDVGINRIEDGSLVGDVDFSDTKDKASYITPVPGGVGPMTIATLLKNTLQAAKGLTKYGS